MDQAASEGRPAVSAAAGEGRQKTPEEIETEIQQTREDLGDTVEALAGKADVKAQAKDKIAQVRATAQHKKDELASRARAATPDSAGTGAQQVASAVQRKPVPFAVAGAFAGGIVVGWILRRR
jgi:Protein of unknown function (DUF3618)